MTSLKNISKNFLVLFVGNVVSQAVFFFGILIVAAKVSPEAFGRFSFAQAFTLFFLRLSEFGVETYSIRRVVLEGDKAEVVFESLYARMYNSVFVYAAAVLCLYVLPVPAETKTITAICLLSLFGNFFLLEWLFQAKEQMHIVGVSRFIRSFIFTVPLIFSSMFQLGESTIAWLYVGSFIVPSLVLMILYRTRTETRIPFITPKRSFHILRQSAPIGASVTLMQIPFNVGTIIAGLLLSSEYVAVYSAGYRVSLVLWSFGIVALYNAIFPAMTAMAKDAEGFEHLVKRLSLIFALASGVLTIAAVAFSPIVIHILYQGKYDAAIDVLRISLVTVSIILARTAIEYSLLALNRLTAYLKGMVLVSVLYIILGYGGTSFFGIHGMVYAALTCEVAYTFYLLSQFKFIRVRNEIFTMWLKIIASTILAVACFHYVGEYNELAGVIVMILTFCALMFQLFRVQIRNFTSEVLFT